MSKIESLESRRLMAGTVTLSNGVLTVMGTDKSDVINVSLVEALKVGSAKSPTLSPTLSYSVSVDGSSQGVFLSSTVKQIDIYGMGGNDKITGPLLTYNPVNVHTGSGTTAKTTHLILAVAPVAPMYVEGGRGNDTIVGGSGNDTLKGELGDDVLIDTYGSNVLEGDAGHNVFNASEEKTLKGLVNNVTSGSATTGYTLISTPDITKLVPVYSGTPDTIIGHDGDDIVRYDSDDVVQGFSDNVTLPIPDGALPSPLLYDRLNDPHGS